MNRLTLVRAGINPAEGVTRFGDAETFEQMLRMFPEDSTFDSLKEILATDADVQSKFAVAHSLKGVSGNLSLQNLYEAVFPLVEELRAGSVARVGELFPPVEEAYLATVEGIQNGTKGA